MLYRSRRKPVASQNDSIPHTFRLQIQCLRPNERQKSSPGPLSGLPHKAESAHKPVKRGSGRLANDDCDLRSAEGCLYSTASVRTVGRGYGQTAKGVPAPLRWSGGFAARAREAVPSRAPPRLPEPEEAGGCVSVAQRVSSSATVLTS